MNMSDMLSMEEIDALLHGVDDYDVEYPMFFYVKKDGKLKIIEVNEKEAEKILGNSRCSYPALKEGIIRFGYDILEGSTEKKDLIRTLHNRYKDMQDSIKEIDFLKEYLDEYPEYIV